MSAMEGAVLLTGASGLLGGRVARLLNQRGAVGTVITSTRGAAVNEEAGQLSGERIALDLSSEILLPQGIATIVHVAGEKHDRLRMTEVNDHGTRRLVMAAAAAGVRRFVYISSVGSYGAPAHAGEVTESFPHVPRNLYELSKDAGEAHVRRVCAAAGMQAVILQPTNVIGRVPGRSAPLLGLVRMVARRRFAWIGHGDPVVNYVGVEDVAAAIVAVAESAVVGTYIVNTPCALADLVGWIASELGIPAPTMRLPLALGRILAGLGGLAQKASGRSMPFNSERLLELTNTTRYVPDALTRDTGYAYPSGIEKVIRDLARAYLREELT